MTEATCDAAGGRNIRHTPKGVCDGCDGTRQPGSASLPRQDDPARLVTAAATRAVVTDPPGEPTRLALYRDDVLLASVQLDPASAVGIAGDLLEAARLRLGRARAADAAKTT